MTRARDLADSADKDISGTLTLDGLTVDGAALVQAGNSATATLSLNNANGSGTLSQLNLGYTADPDHGNIRYDGNMIFSTGANTERMRISGGNVGIGATTVDTKLHLEESGATSLFLKTQNSAGALLVGCNASGNSFVSAQTSGKPLILETENTERMRIDSSGNVGIGDSSPTVWSSVQPSLNLRGTSSSHAERSGALIFKSQNGTYQTALDFEQGNEFRIHQSSNSGSSWSERMRIDSSGNVGIGSSSMSSYYSDRLVVGVGDEDGITIAGSSGQQHYIMFADGTSGNERYRGYIAYDHADDHMKLATNGTERLRIMADGNIGVNTTTPVDFGDSFKNLNLNGVKGGALSFTRGTNSATRQWDIYTSDADQLIFYRGGSTDGMVMKSDGTISVNHNTPLSTFHVRNGGGANSGSLRVGGNGASLGLELTYDQSGSTTSVIQANPTYTSDAQLLKIRSDGDRNPNQLVIKGDGHIGINNAAPARRFQVSAGGMAAAARFDRSSDSSQRGIIEFLSASSGSTVGEIKITSTTAHYTSASDYRLKENVVELTSATNRLKQLKPKRFNFIADADTTIDGFLAHEAQAVVPEAVSGEKDAMMDEEYEVKAAVTDDDGNVVEEAEMGTRSVPDYQGIDQAKLVPLLTAALQEAIAKIETLEARITALEG